MTYCELKGWSIRHNLPDTWWIAINGQTRPTPVSLAFALELKCGRPDFEIAVMNAEARRRGAADWTHLHASRRATSAPSG